MGVVRITIVGPAGSSDYAAADDKPIGDLIGLLYAESAASLGEGWEVVLPPSELPLNLDRTLAELEILDGSILHVRVRNAGRQQPTSRPLAPEDEPGSPLQRTRETLPERVSGLRRLAAAARASLPRARAADVSPSPQRGMNPELSTRPPTTTPLERAHAAWQATDYVRRLGTQIQAPRLHRCVTVAVIGTARGVGCTTTTALLGSMFAQLRGDRTIAIDADAEPSDASLGRVLTPDHERFVDDVRNLLTDPELTATKLDRHLGQGPDGLFVLPAPAEAERIGKLDGAALTDVATGLAARAGVLLFDCGTSWRQGPAQAVTALADQIVLVCEPEPPRSADLADAVFEVASDTAELFVVVNMRTGDSAGVELDKLAHAAPHARGIIIIDNDPALASEVARAQFSWKVSAGTWPGSVRELAALLTADWENFRDTAT